MSYENVKEIIDLDYKKEEYKESEYLHRADWGGLNKIIEIEKKFADENQKKIYESDRFKTIWDFYLKNVIDFDSKANRYKRLYQIYRFISIVLTVATPQLITFFSILNLTGTNTAITFLFTAIIPIILTFISAFFINLLNVRKYEPLFMNFRITCEKLKSAGFEFLFVDKSNLEEEIQKFIEKVIGILEQQYASYEGIFTK
ncbi:MAG: DUF4231 domain-containing protein [Promethearchaeota archaeon]